MRVASASGAKAPAVTATELTLASALQSMPSSSATSCAAHPDDDDGLDLPGRGLHRLLAVGSGVADVLHRRDMDQGKAALQRPEDLARVIDRQRRLRPIGDRASVVGRSARPPQSGSPASLPARLELQPASDHPRGGALNAAPPPGKQQDRTHALTARTI